LGSNFLRSVHAHLPKYMASHPEHCSLSISMTRQLLTFHKFFSVLFQRQAEE
jgi:hypothetical protein